MLARNSYMLELLHIGWKLDMIWKKKSASQVSFSGAHQDPFPRWASRRRHCPWNPVESIRLDQAPISTGNVSCENWWIWFASSLQMEKTLTSFSKLRFRTLRSFVGSHHIAETERPSTKMTWQSSIKFESNLQYPQFTMIHCCHRRRIGILWTTVVCTVCSGWQLSTLVRIAFQHLPAAMGLVTHGDSRWLEALAEARGCCCWHFVRWHRTGPEEVRLDDGRTLCDHISLGEGVQQPQNLQTYQKALRK
jgi:hypothetical protein